MARRSRLLRQSVNLITRVLLILPNLVGGPGVGGSQVGGGTVRIGGRVPWGAEVAYAYRAGYDSRGRVSVTHVVDERGYSVMLTEAEGA